MSRKNRRAVESSPPPAAEPQSRPPQAVRPRSKQQADIFANYDENDLLFLIGAADTGKTFGTCAKAWQEVTNGTKERIVVFRPAVDAGENLGFDPGTFEEKLAPWTEPIQDSFAKIAGRNNKMIGEVVEYRSLGRSRGLTFENAVVILTEAQNATYGQFKLLLTRMGQGTRIICEGDDGQCDLPRGKSGFVSVADKLKTLGGVKVMRLVEEPAGTPNGRHALVRHFNRLL